MQNAIGLDHLAAVAKLFYKGQQQEAICRRVFHWLRTVNLDTIDLLDEVIEHSAATAGSMEIGFQRSLQALKKHEAATRRKFLAEGAKLRAELEELRFPSESNEFKRIPAPPLRVAKQVAAALLTIGMPATSGYQQAVGQEIKTPPSASSTEQASLSSLAGTVTDASGAVVVNAMIIITNLDTGQTRTLKTNAQGQYAANDLAAGRYSVKAESQGFRTTVNTGIVLKAGDRGRADVVLAISDIGCCEYAAVPLKAEPEDLIVKKKPFTYYVGERKDHNTFQGIAKLVYGDQRKWVQIFEANRNVTEKPGLIPSGTEIVIPRAKRAVPQLISKVMPVYPPDAVKAHAAGDVVLDVSLKEDGTVEQVNVIDGSAVLTEPATTAVKQWRYRLASGKGKESVRKFVVVISFGKDGKVVNR